MVHLLFTPAKGTNGALLIPVTDSKGGTSAWFAVIPFSVFYSLIPWLLFI